MFITPNDFVEKLLDIEIDKYFIGDKLYFELTKTGITSNGDVIKLIYPKINAQTFVIEPTDDGKCLYSIEIPNKNDIEKSKEQKSASTGIPFDFEED